MNKTDIEDEYLKNKAGYDKCISLALESLDELNQSMNKKLVKNNINCINYQLTFFGTITMTTMQASLRTMKKLFEDKTLLNTNHEILKGKIKLMWLEETGREF